MTATQRGIVLVGHGGLQSDCPNILISKLKRLESHRRKNNLPASSEELEIDQKVRNWPRTRETDPYKAGLESVAENLQRSLRGVSLKIAYNEFCSPTLPEAVESLINKGCSEITVLSTLFTPGGSHSEIEIPEEIQEIYKRFPSVNVDYAWPFDLAHIAKFLNEHIELHRKNLKQMSITT